MNKIISMCSISLFFVFGQAFAAPTWHTSTIKSIYPLADGRIVLTFITDSAACSSGSEPKYYYLSSGANGVTEAGFKNIYSTALAGAASGKEVIINFESDTGACYINRLAVNFQ